MSGYYQAAESCGCGAIVNVEACTTSSLGELLKAFREAHVRCRISGPAAAPRDPGRRGC